MEWDCPSVIYFMLLKECIELDINRTFLGYFIIFCNFLEPNGHSTLKMDSVHDAGFSVFCSLYRFLNYAMNFLSHPFQTIITCHSVWLNEQLYTVWWHLWDSSTRHSTTICTLLKRKLPPVCIFQICSTFTYHMYPNVRWSPFTVVCFQQNTLNMTAMHWNIRIWL